MSEGRQIKSAGLITSAIFLQHTMCETINYDMVHSFLFSSIDGVALLNDDGGVEV